MPMERQRVIHSGILAGPSAPCRVVRTLEDSLERTRVPNCGLTPRMPGQYDAHRTQILIRQFVPNQYGHLLMMLPGWPSPTTATRSARSNGIADSGTRDIASARPAWA